jgi:serine protease Do
MKGLWRTTLVAGLALAFLASSLPAAAPFPVDTTKRIEPIRELPSVLDKDAPESVDDLKTFQAHVKKVIKAVTPAVVGIIIGGSSGSGVIIDDQGHILTAGHVSGKPGRECLVILPDGKRLKAKSLGQNNGLDSGMLKITDKGKFPYVTLGDAGKLKVSQWVISIGHPGGFKPTRSPVVRVGRVMRSNASLIRTDCTLVGGDSGGPLFDMTGKVIGIHSRIGFSIDENIHVPVDTYKDTWNRLVKGDSWNSNAGLGFFAPRPRATAYLGVVFGRSGDDLKIAEVSEGTPAEKAGIKVGDIIVGVDNASVKNRDELADVMMKKKPDDEVTVVLKRGEQEVKIKVKLGKRPG